MVSTSLHDPENLCGRYRDHPNMIQYWACSKCTRSEIHFYFSFIYYSVHTSLQFIQYFMQNRIIHFGSRQNVLLRT